MVGFCDSVIGQLARVYGSERMKFVRPQSQSWFFWNSPFWRFCLLHFCIFVFSFFWKSDNWKKKVCSWGIISTAAWRRSWIIPSWSGPFHLRRFGVKILASFCLLHSCCLCQPQFCGGSFIRSRDSLWNWHLLSIGTRWENLLNSVTNWNPVRKSTWVCNSLFDSWIVRFSV